MADNDSRLRGAKNVGLPSNVRGNFRARNDLDDLFRLQVNERSSFNLRLSGIARGNNVDVELYRFKRPVAAVLRSIGRIDFRALKPNQRNPNFTRVAASRKGGNQVENIASVLEADNYFIRILRRQGNRTNYSMALTTTPSPVPGPNPIPGPNPGPIPGPNPNPIPGPSPNPDPNTPVPLTPIPLTTPSVTGQLAPTEARKRYSLTIPTGDFRFKLTGLSADADLEIRSADGNTVIASSLNSGNANEQLIQPLDAGQYTIDVLRKAGNAANTNFTLNYTKLTDAVKNTEADPTFLGNIGAPNGTPNALPPNVERVNYVVAGGKDSPSDVYSFTLPERGFVRVTLAGAPIDSNTLFGDLDVELYAQGKTPQDGISSTSLGKNVGEVFGGTLAARNQAGNPITYLLRVAPKAGTPDGSTYKLNINYGGARDKPSIIRDILPGSDPSNAQNFVEINGIAYFSANSVDAQGQSKVSLWSSDGGTLDGTTKIFDFSANARLDQFTNVNGKLYFVVNDPASGGSKLWTSDGLTSGTTQIADPTTGTPIDGPRQLVGIGQDLYFYTESLGGTGFTRNQQLYRLQQGQPTAEVISSDGFRKVNNADAPDFQNSLVNVNGTLYFAALGTQDGRQLWRVNTGAGSPVVEKMLLNSDGSADPQNLINAGNQLFLTAAIEEAGFTSRELIRIDNFSTAGFNPANFEVFNLNGDNSGEAGNLTYLESTKTLYFTGDDVVIDPVNGDSNTGIELFKLQFASETTENVTPAIVQDIAVGNSGSTPSSLVTFGNRVIFLASDGTTNELWTTDGTTTGKLSQVNGLGNLSSLTDIKELTVINNNTLFFVATDATIGEELWKMTLDGATGTLTGFDIQVGAGSSSPNSLAAVGGQVFFVANDGVNGTEPWSLPA